MRLLLSLEGQRSTTTLPTLIERLNNNRIFVAGGAMTSDHDAILLFDYPQFADEAIVWLARVGIAARRG
jgi:hypothetical protein